MEEFLNDTIILLNSFDIRSKLYLDMVKQFAHNLAKSMMYSTGEILEHFFKQNN